MKNLQLLDCTLRDGGYLNDWQFGYSNIVNIFERMVSSGVDILEIGFLDGSRPFDLNRTIMPDTACAGAIYGNLDKKNTLIVGMIDFGTCPIGNLQPCAESYLDGIRVIFKKHIRNEAIAYCRQVKELGYKVFVQAVSITSYSEAELLDLVRLVNDFEPYALSMVDTYGLLHQDNLYSIYQLLDQNLKASIAIGYHAHNNFQMGYANCIRMIEAKTERSMLVDGTLYGMGKSAGNAPVELLAMYMNENCDKQYDINQMLEAVETSILDIYRVIPWGYNLFYYLAASNKCHPSYVSYLMNKKTLSIKSINDTLRKIDEEHKLMYDADTIEQLYRQYQECDCNDARALSELAERLKNRRIIAIGPGSSTLTEQDKWADLFQQPQCAVVSINFIPDFVKPDFVFLTNSKRYVQLANRLSEQECADICIIATSNVTKASGLFQYELNYSRLIDQQAEVQDNSLFMFLRLMMELEVREIDLVGFDGYSETKMNYYKTNMEYANVRQMAQRLNVYGQNFIRAHQQQLNIHFITPSYYQIDSAQERIEG